MTLRAARQRAHAALALNEVLNRNRTIDWVLRERAGWSSEPFERELLYGCLRRYFSLTHTVDRALAKPLREKDFDLYCLMLVGTYQLRYSEKPDHAAVNETVAACAALRKPWAKGLVNAVLRNLPEAEQSFDHPRWLIDAIRGAYPAAWQAVLAANNTRAPMALRVNPRKTHAEDYLRTLPAAEPGPLPDSIVLAAPMSARDLPGWQQGAVAVQDLGAQFAAHLLTKDLNATSELHVLDACAAPGGKLAHLSERLPAAEIVGLDISARRLEDTRQVLERLRHRMTLIEGDATTQAWWDGTPYDRILLDAPCSGTGTLRRHPDIKVLLQPDAIEQQARTQLELLHNLWTLLAPGGRLLYCTCSLLPRENDAVIEEFLADLGSQNRLQYAAADATRPAPQADREANVVSIDLPTGQPTRCGWQLLPTDPRTDGFYYALLEKPALASTPVRDAHMQTGQEEGPPGA